MRTVWVDSEVNRINNVMKSLRYVLNVLELFRYMHLRNTEVESFCVDFSLTTDLFGTECLIDY